MADETSEDVATVRIRIQVLYSKPLPRRQQWGSICEIMFSEVPYSGIYTSELTSVVYEASKPDWIWGGSGSRKRSRSPQSETQTETGMDFYTVDPTGELSVGEILVLTEIIEITRQEETLADFTEEEVEIVAESFAIINARRSKEVD